MMNRTKCLQMLAPHLTDEIVVATYSTASEWVEMSDRAQHPASARATR